MINVSQTVVNLVREFIEEYADRTKAYRERTAQQDASTKALIEMQKHQFAEMRKI